MLVLTRKPGEAAFVMIPGRPELRIEVLSIRGSKVRVGFSGSRDVIIRRSELNGFPSVPRVLIIDDDRRTMVAIKTALRALGLEVATAQWPLEAFEKAIAQKPEVLLIKASQPCIELAEHLRSLPELRSSAMIALANPDMLEDHQARELGFAARISPIPELEELQSVLQRSG